MNYRNNKISLFIIFSTFFFLSCEKGKEFDVYDIYTVYYSSLNTNEDDTNLVLLKYPLCLSFDELFKSLKSVDKSSYSNAVKKNLKCKFPNLNYESEHIDDVSIILQDTSYTKNKPSEEYKFNDRILIFSEPILDDDFSKALIVEYFSSPSSLDELYFTVVTLEFLDSKWIFKEREMIEL